MAVGLDTHRSSYARSVTLPLSYTVLADQIALINGFVGITETSGDSGDSIALDIERQVIEVELPSALVSTLAVGEIVYVIEANVTGHTFDDNAFTKTATSNKAFLKVTELISATVVAGVLLALEV
jgi:TctA family transporter